MRCAFTSIPKENSQKECKDSHAGGIEETQRKLAAIKGINGGYVNERITEYDSTGFLRVA
ncbi:MAG: hypothetical protein LBE70_04985 [Nitrososphaerota archaeon]|nr:hypothetical protein [Nitrososphaerota archaeon]